ncbi:MAG: CDP-alcohol phosphatidyltransferase family protein, partial [Gammaproteobacteria bacterium]|nr:CDP-alcohol phosphatidyltransferase family protein [Gammaproteobacteria bacterium]
SIISGINGDYIASAVAVVVAGVLDGLDGRVARLTNTQSDFGVQYDSLCDLVSFGLAPALLAFNW